MSVSGVGEEGGAIYICGWVDVKVYVVCQYGIVFCYSDIFISEQSVKCPSHTPDVGEKVVL